MSLGGDIVKERYDKLINEFHDRLIRGIPFDKTGMSNFWFCRYKEHFNISDKLKENILEDIEVEEDLFDPSTHIQNYRPLYPFENKYDNEFVQVGSNELTKEIYKTSCGRYWARTSKEIALINRFEKIYSIIVVVGLIDPFRTLKNSMTVKDGYKVIILGKLKE